MNVLPIRNTDEDKGAMEDYATSTEQIKNYIKGCQQEQQDWKNNYYNLKQRKESLLIESKCEQCPEFDFRSHLSKEMQSFLSECEQREETSIKEAKRLLDQIDNICLLNFAYEQQAKELGILRKNVQDQIHTYQKTAIMKMLDHDCDFNLEEFCQPTNDCFETTFLFK